MCCARIKDHASFRPASLVLQERASWRPTPPGNSAALAEIDKSKRLLQQRPRPNLQAGIAFSWAATPRAIRRNILSLAGLSPDRWESPIHSFTDSERIAMRAAAHRAIRAYERLLNAI